MAQVKAKGVPFSTTDENVDQNSAWNLKGSTKRNSFGIIAIAIWKLKALKSSFIPTFFSSSCHSSLFSYFFWCGIFYAKPFLGHNLYSFWFNGEKSTLLFPFIFVKIQALMLINKMFAIEEVLLKFLNSFIVHNPIRIAHWNK